MFRSIRNIFARINGAMALIGSVMTDAITVVISASTHIVSAAFDWLTFGLIRAASKLPKPTAKQPTGTAQERMQLIPATTYARTQDTRRKPTIENSWRMCASI